MADWEWLFTSEYGRDKMLRSEIEDLASASASASAHHARLSSQLARLQGSLESRLAALSAAFDAYVELGDVREQLTAFADTAAVRRESAGAIEALAAGRTPSPVEAEAEDYWLPYAVNAVIALAAGQADPDAEARARELSRDADLFVVATAGAVGHGGLVADRVPDLLVADDALRPEQVALWAALLEGIYPSGSDLLATVGEHWRPALAAGDAAEWRTWVSDRSRAPDVTGDLRWVRDLLARRSVTAPDADATTAARAPDARQALRMTAVTMVGEGSDDERELLARSRELRRRIENPGSAPTAGRPDEPRQPVRALVRAELADALATGDAAVGDRLVEWIRPGLAKVVDDVAGTTRPEPAADEVRSPGGTVAVTPAGPDAARYAQVVSNIADTHATGNRTLYAASAVGGVLALVAVAVAITGGSSTVLVLLVLAALVLGGVALVQLRRRSVARREREEDLATLRRSVDVGVERSRVARAAYDEESAAVTQLVRELRSTLGLS